MALTPLPDALASILAQVTSITTTEQVSLSSALGRVIVHDIFATLQVPPMDNSAMDGYALCIEGVGEGDILPVSQRIPAGAVAHTLQPGSAARIFTGAEVPAGADAVVMQENTEVVAEGIKLLKLPQKGENIRCAGNDIDIGQLILRAGQRLRAQDLGLLASLGMPLVEVIRRPLVTVLCTGSELVEPGQPLERGQIYNSNRVVITSLLKGWGCDVVECDIVQDNIEDVVAALRSASQSSDLIVSSGGVSVGEEDHVRQAVEMLGTLSLWRLAIKPGKPVAFGHIDDTPFLGLPGNPSSSFVTALLVARPVVQAISGCEVTHPVEIFAEADFDIVQTGSREEFLRIKLIQIESGWRAVAYANQSSGALLAASWGNALARIPIGQKVAKGDRVQVLLFDSLL